MIPRGPLNATEAPFRSSGGTCRAQAAGGPQKLACRATRLCCRPFLRGLLHASFSLTFMIPDRSPPTLYNFLPFFPGPQPHLFRCRRQDGAGIA